MQTPFYFSPKPVIRTFWDFYPANLHVHLFLQRFHMDIDVGTVAEGLAQLVFDIRGATVRFVKRYPAWHTQMHLYGDIAAYTRLIPPPANCSRRVCRLMWMHL